MRARSWNRMESEMSGQAWRMQLSGFLETLSWRDVPEGVREQAHYVLMDTMGAVLAGAMEPEYQAIGRRMVETSQGASTAMGFPQGVAAGTAAFLNGMAGTFLEMDEGHRVARGHPAVHVLPAVWAEAEQRGASGTDVLLALIAGYEACARLGAAARLRAQMHPHGTWGVLGAAVGVGKLRGYDADRLGRLINVASSLTLATSKRTMLEGATVRNAYAGVANQLGLLAADLVDSGFTGEREGVETVFGSVVSEVFDADAMVGGLGERWEIMHNYFKQHACCRYAHGALDALEAILAEQGNLSPDEIDGIEVRTYQLAAELDSRFPDSMLAGKFSIPFALATRLVTGSSGVASFTAEAVRDERALALARRVTVVEDPALTARLPQQRPAQVSVRIGGRHLRAEVTYNHGDDVHPYTRVELEQKFEALALRALPSGTVPALRDALLGFSNLDAVASLQPILRSARNAEIIPPGGAHPPPGRTEA